MTGSERAKCACDSQRAQQIARLNDQLRTRAEGGVIMVTRRVRGMPGFDPQRLMALLAAYDAFDTHNDPHGERDFGDVDLDGETLFWKVDYYDMDMIYGSPDPADAAVTRRVLTVMLAGLPDEYNDMSKGTVFTTRRLRLRTWRGSDVAPYSKHCNTDKVMENLGGVMTLKHVRAEVQWFQRHQDRYGHTFWVVERKRDRAFLGFCGIITITDRESPLRELHEIGWRIRADMWRRGYAFEAASAVMDWADDRLKGEHLVARINKRNVASQALASKLWMRRQRKLERAQARIDATLAVFRTGK
jgi:RimJ/RimL family protein N-acetyltransferase